MNRFVNRKSLLFVLIALTLVVAFAGGVLLRGGSTHVQAAAPKTQAKSSPHTALSSNPICSRIGKNIQVSSGAKMACFGPQANGSTTRGKSPTSKFGSNVDAANPREDITPNGTQVYGQSEVSIAGVGPYVVEAWNDATGFFAPCPSPMNKEELTGFGFSADGGKSFKDQGGLPNDCTTGSKYFGDPTVETWQSGGKTYFYIGSLYITGNGISDLALDACTATGTGAAAALTCSSPVIIATGGPGDFLDKEFFSIDPARGRLYTSYTRFGSTGNSVNGQVELAVCDIGTPSGGSGAGGGTAGTPVCFPGPSPAPYFVVQPSQACENEGAYPAVHVNSGDVYVTWEYNWATNFLGPAPCNTTEPVQNRIAYIPFSCLTLTPVSPCATTPLIKAVNIVSLDLAFIPGYNRNPTGSPANDFPRIAVSDKFGTVSIVWNDARLHPLGDILLQSFHLVSLSNVQSSPVRVNSLANGGLHFLPALRRSDDEGMLNVSFYQRNSPNTALTNVYDAINLDPRTTSTPASNTLVTTVPTDWNNVSSDIIPNFGDYTDNYILATANAPYVNDFVYVAWSDGRLGLPQPFEAYAGS